MVNRLLIPAIASVDGYIEGTPGIPSGDQSATDRATGLGDINYSIYFSPAKSKPIWGVGPSITFQLRHMTILVHKNGAPVRLA